MNSSRKGRPYKRLIFREFRRVLREATSKLPIQSIAVHGGVVQVLLLVQITACERPPGFMHHRTTRCSVTVLRTPDNRRFHRSGNEPKDASESLIDDGS